MRIIYKAFKKYLIVFATTIFINAFHRYVFRFLKLLLELTYSQLYMFVH